MFHQLPIDFSTIQNHKWFVLTRIDQTTDVPIGNKHDLKSPCASKYNNTI